MTLGLLLAGAIGRECGNEPGDSLKQDQIGDGLWGSCHFSFYAEHQQAQSLRYQGTVRGFMSAYMERSPIRGYIAQASLP